MKGEDRMGAKGEKEPGIMGDRGTSGPHISLGPGGTGISKRLVHHSCGANALVVVMLGSIWARVDTR